MSSACNDQHAILSPRPRIHSILTSTIWLEFLYWGLANMKRDKHFRPTPDSSHRDIPALRFWDTIDRSQFELALSDNDKYATFLQALADPTYARCSFPTLLRKFNISLHEAQALYTDHMRHMALLQMSSQLPQVIADVTEDAKSHMRTCPRCDGEKVIEFTRGNKRVSKKCPD